MKPARGISKPFAVIVLFALAVTVVLVWHTARRKPSTTEEPPSPAAAETVSSEPPTETNLPAGAPSEQGSLDLVPLPLTNVLTETENHWWDEKLHFVVPVGTQSFGGIEFHLEGVIQLRSTHVPQFRNRVSLPLTEAGLTNARMASLHLLGGTAWDSDAGASVAQVVWRYSDGTAARTELVYLNHVRDWSRIGYEEPIRLPYPFSKVVWGRADPESPRRYLRLYRVTLGNPQPLKSILGIDVASANGTATLFFVAATLDPLAPGQRPDNSPDLEPADSSPPRHIDLLVQSPQGQAVPQAKVNPVFNQRIETKLVSTKARGLMTDAFGGAQVGFPSADLERLEIAVSHDDYAGRKVVWNLTAGDIVPANYVLKLGDSLKIGGVVVDESDTPVSGAQLSFHRFWRGGEDTHPKGEQADFSSREATTDGFGAWQVGGLPPELLTRIGFDVKHPDFMGTNITVGGNAAIEQQLRAGTHRLMLRRGLEVRGLVTDDANNPISGGSVWVAERNFRERQETKSDDAGRFLFRNVPGATCSLA